MGRFLRIVLLIILAVLGSGTGICGLLGLGFTTFSVANGQKEFVGVALVLSVICVSVAVGCFFGIRALNRRLRKPTAPTTPELPVEPPSSGSAR
jgi:ABC-type proline/glycine betaine transport system permease subunit